MVKLCSCKSILPSTSPSRYKSSLPESSPLTRTDFPMCATSAPKISPCLNGSLERVSFLISGVVGNDVEGTVDMTCDDFSSLTDFHIYEPPRLVPHPVFGSLGGV